MQSWLQSHGYPPASASWHLKTISFPLSDAAWAYEGRSDLGWPHGGSVAQKPTVALTMGLSCAVGPIGAPGVCSCVFLHS